VTTVAEQLKHAREARGLALAEVVETTQLKTDQVQALEGGRYEEFAATAYVRGFVRSYSNMLKLDTEALLEQLNIEMGQAREGPPDGSNAALRAGILDAIMLAFSRVNWRLVLPVFVFVALAAGVFYGVKWKREFDSTDHLKNIGPGLYGTDATSDADRLPLDSLDSGS
jgi:cytoskeletal protein RodZ